MGNQQQNSYDQMQQQAQQQMANQQQNNSNSQQSQQQQSSGQTDMQQSQSQQSSQQMGQMGQQSAGQAQSGSEQGTEQGQMEGMGVQGNPNGGHSETEGAKTQMNVQTIDDTLKGQSTNAPTTSEIIQSSGQSGFASQAYREVYQTYEHAAEEILENDNVPQGYRHYIEKYFDMIRPQK